MPSLGVYKTTEELLEAWDREGESIDLPADATRDEYLDLLDGFAERLSNLPDGCTCPMGHPPCSFCMGGGHELRANVRWANGEIERLDRKAMTALPGWGRFA